MSFWWMMVIMLLAGVIGGTVNFLLPTNAGENKPYKDLWWKCFLLGVGATLLVPLFLEIAQSKLLDDVYMGKKPDPVGKDNALPITTRHDTVKVTQMVDSATKRLIKTDTVRAKGPEQPGQPPKESNNGKNYFLYAAYCVLAAASGFRFIQMLLKNVVKEEQLEASRQETKMLKGNLEFKRRQDLIEAQKDETKAKEKFVQSSIGPLPAQVERDNIKKVLASIRAPMLKDITHLDDPQKDRFGGRASRNGRQLKALVKESGITAFFDVTFWVESPDANKPLTDPVLFYIHPTFHPSVFTINPDQFEEGKAMYKVVAWGAFTIGCITDKGETMLELDLAENKDFPLLFRQR